MPRERSWHRLPPRSVVDLDGFADAIDPSLLTPDQFVHLVQTLEHLRPTGISLEGMRTDTFVRFLSRARRDQLDALTTHPELRHVVFAEVFRRMAAHLRPERRLDAVIHWRFPGPPDEDRFETTIADGTCVTLDHPTADPRVTITISPTDFLRAVTGAVGLPMLFLSARVRVKGDMALAATLISHFDLPRP